MTVMAAKINLQLPGLQKGVEAERSGVQLQNFVGCIITITFSMCDEVGRQRELIKLSLRHLTELCMMLIAHTPGQLTNYKRIKVRPVSVVLPEITQLIEFSFVILRDSEPAGFVPACTCQACSFLCTKFDFNLTFNVTFFYENVPVT